MLTANFDAGRREQTYDRFLLQRRLYHGYRNIHTVRVPNSTHFSLSDWSFALVDKIEDALQRPRLFDICIRLVFI
jgi:hypothetical protein